MRRLLLWAILLSLPVACGGGDPPAPQFNLDGFQATDVLEDLGGGDAWIDAADGMAPDLLPDTPPPLDVEPDGSPDALPDVEPGCGDDDECLDAFEEIPVCQRPACVDAACALVPVDDGEACADDDPCTDDEVCLEGACAAGTFFDCDDGDPCTDDGCDGLGGCTHAFNEDPCDDGTACTTDDVCGEGVCAGTNNLCDDENPCTFDGCEPQTGDCLHEPAAIPCDDGNACTTNDFCVSGNCVGINVLVCDDANPCTDDSCDSLAGCQHLPNDAPCDDGEACTPVDQCVDGACTGLENVCLCDNDADCQPLQDDDLCNGSLACLDGLCQIDPASVIACDDPAPDDCVVFQCDPATGSCKAFSKADDAPCDDQDVCTLGEVCLGGLCTPAETVDCDDGELCTAETCDPAEGCQYVPSLAPCDDGDPCTGDDACTAGLACAGAPVDCDDGDACTLDSCDGATGACLHAPKLCADEDLCTEDVCDGDSGACLFTAKSCSDGDLCTLDSCDPGTGTCVNAPKDCDDGDPCTQDLCDDASGLCGNPPVDCDDGDPCTLDSCDPATGACVNVAQECDDGDPCTQDLLDCAAQTCTHPPTVCDDGDACTTDTCDPASGCVSTPVACDDGDACTTDTCDPDSGCVFTPVTCDDGDACTTDACDPDSGCLHTPVTCDDGDACTTDACDPDSGCLHTPVTCDDGDACTTDACDPDGGCVFAPVSCDDGNGCTDDSCDPGSGCVYTPNTAPCDDGDACTAGDLCVDGECQPTIVMICVDLNPCTDDSCDPGSGCVHTPNSDPCDDGDACTENDICGAGVCLGPDAIDCDDGDPCTIDACDPDSGCTHAPLSGPACDDGEACTVGDVCFQGTCSPGQDVCEPCTGLQDGQACNDDNPTTLADMCLQGACVGWTRADFEPRASTVSGAMNDVAWSAGQFLAVGRDEASGNGGDGAYTWAVTLDGGDVALYHDDSERTDTVYVAVSNGLAVGANGAASHYDGAWAHADELEALLQEGINLDEVRAVWGGRFADLSDDSPQTDRWWLLGRNAADTLGLTKLCTRTEWAGGAVSWECENMYLDTYAEYEYPAAMDAVLTTAGGGGGWQIDKAYMVSDAISQLSDPTTYWLDAFTTTALDEWNFLGYLSDPPPYAQNWDDVVAVTGSQAWAVGSRGLIARIQGNGIQKIATSGSPSLTQADWTSAFTLGGLLVITGVKTQDTYTPQGLQRTRSFLIRTHRGNNPDSGWDNHTLGSVSTLCGAWIPCDAIVNGNHLTESASHGSEAYLVGRAWGPSVQPDQDAPEAQALLYHLDVPTL